MRGLRETKDLEWGQGRRWEQVHSGHAGPDFSGMSREPTDTGARAWKGAPRWKWGPGTCQHTGDDPGAPGMGSHDLEKSLNGRLGCTGCSEWRSEGMKKRTGQDTQFWRVYSFRGRGTANKTVGTGSRKLPMYSNREAVTTRVLAIGLLTSRHTPFGIFFISVPPKKTLKQLN